MMNAAGPDGSEAATPAGRVLAYFESEADREVAVRVLRSYFSSTCFTGAAFDRLAHGSDPWRYTAVDMLAVSTLSVTVPARAALAFLDSTDMQGALGRIPSGASIWEQPELLDRGAAAWRLWDEVIGYHDIGRTIASKLLAVKRPRLVPVFDQHVDQALTLGDNYWAFWQEVAGSKESDRLRGMVREAARLAEVSIWVPDLRIIDVVVWMRQHGAALHLANGCTKCDLAGVGQRPRG